MSIPDIYHKYRKKSRSSSADRPLGKWVDIFLIIGVIIVLVVIIVNRTFGKVNTPGNINSIINITISEQCEEFFGKDAVEALIQEFEGIYPNLRIQAAGQEDADIIFFDDSEIDQPEQWIANQIVPLVSFVDLFFYNIDILKAANSDRPPKTRAEFLTAARAVANKSPSQPPQQPVYAFALGLSRTDIMALRRDFYPWVWADGGDVSSGAGAAVLSRAAINTISFLGQLESEGLLAPQSFEKTGTERLEEFARGEIAMMIASAQNIAYLRRNAQDLNFDVSTMPTTLQGKGRLGLSGIYAGINSNCTLPDEAGIFLAFVAEKSQLLAEAIGAVPGSLPIPFPSEYIVKDTLYTKAWDIFEAADIVDYYPILEEEIREKLAEVIK